MSLLEACVYHRKSYEDQEVQLFNNKVFRSRSLRERSTKFPTSLILYMRKGFAETSSLPLATNACGCSSTGGQVDLLFWHRSKKIFEAAHPDLFHTKMNVFLISPQTCPFSLNTSLVKERRSSNFTPQVKEARNQSQIFNRKSISRNTTHRLSYHLQAL